MRLTAERIEVLLELGLTDNQARVYLALLEFPSLHAGALAKAAQIPRNRLYEVLEELQAVGLVEILLDESRKYRAKPLSGYLDRNAAELRDRIARLEAQRDQLDATFQPPALSNEVDLHAGATRVLLTRRAVARELDRMVEGATQSLLAIGSTGGWMRLAEHLAKTPVPVAERGVLELYLPRAADEDAASRFPEVWRKATCRVDLQIRTITLVADRREMVVIHPIPDDDKVRVGRDFALLTDNPAFIHDAVELVRRASGSIG